MFDIAPVRPLHEAAALYWLRRHPGSRTDLFRGRARPMAAVARQPACESLAKAGFVTRRGNVITIADSRPKGSIGAIEANFRSQINRRANHRLGPCRAV